MAQQRYIKIYSRLGIEGKQNDKIAEGDILYDTQLGNFYNVVSGGTLQNISSSTIPGGVAGSLQFSNGANFVGSVDLKYNTVDNALELGVMQQTILNSVNLLANQPTFTTAFLIPVGWKHIIVEFSATLSSGWYRTGRLILAHDTFNAQMSQDFVDSSGLAGFEMECAIVGASIQVRYKNNTADTGTMKYSMRRWN